MVTGGMVGRGDSEGVLGQHIHTVVIKMNRQQGPTV